MLKSKDRKDPEKQSGVEELLGPLAADKFAQLVAIGKLITDWVGQGTTAQHACACVGVGRWWRGPYVTAQHANVSNNTAAVIQNTCQEWPRGTYAVMQAVRHIGEPYVLAAPVAVPWLQVSEEDMPAADNPLDTELGVGVQFEDEDDEDGDEEDEEVEDDDDDDGDEGG